jgi:hypothetical protein
VIRIEHVLSDPIDDDVWGAGWKVLESLLQEAIARGDVELPCDSIQPGYNEQVGGVTLFLDVEPANVHG